MMITYIGVRNVVRVHHQFIYQNTKEMKMKQSEIDFTNDLRRWDIIQHFVDWFTSDDELRKDLNQSLQLYIQQEIWKENE